MKSLRSYFYRAAAWFGMDLQGALRMAARVGDTGTVKTLLEAGARDDTALGVAAFNGNAEAVKLLVQGGANVRAKNNEALRRAAMIGRTDIVKLLLNAGADVHANNGEALSRAEYFGHTETAAVLKEWIARERGAADPEMGRGSAAGPKIHPYQTILQTIGSEKMFIRELTSTFAAATIAASLAGQPLTASAEEQGARPFQDAADRLSLEESRKLGLVWAFLDCVTGSAVFPPSFIVALDEQKLAKGLCENGPKCEQKYDTSFQEIKKILESLKSKYGDDLATVIDNSSFIPRPTPWQATWQMIGHCGLNHGGEVGMLMGYELLRDLPTEEVEIETPMQRTRAHMLAGKKLCLVSILRAGNGLLDGLLELVPSARIGHTGLYRDPDTLIPVEYYLKLPEDMASRQVIIVDPLLATGHSAVAAIDRVKAEDVTDVKFLCLIAAPEGLNTLFESHPDVSVYAAAIDRELNEKGYILPGVGDAGDRIFGTK